MNHSVDAILRDWKVIAAYVVTGFFLFWFVVTSPELAFYVAVCLCVLGAAVLLLSR